MYQFTAVVQGNGMTQRVRIPGFQTKGDAQEFIEVLEKGLEEAVNRGELTRFETTDVDLSMSATLWMVAPKIEDVESCVNYLTDIVID